MTEFIMYSLDLTTQQLKKLMNCKTIQITAQQLKNKGSKDVYLTRRQINKIDKAKRLGIGCRINFSAKQMNKNQILGDGLFEDLKLFGSKVYDKVKPVLNPLVEPAVDILTEKLKQELPANKMTEILLDVGKKQVKNILKTKSARGLGQNLIRRSVKKNLMDGSGIFPAGQYSS